MNELQCVRSYFRALIPGTQLTPYQQLCNNRMKPLRESIEWNYGEIGTIFQLSVDAKTYRLGKRRPYANEQIRVSHLLVNIYNCLNGDKASGHQMFNCQPPVLEDYLHL